VVRGCVGCVHLWVTKTFAYLYMNNYIDRGVGGGCIETQKKQKQFYTTLKKRPKINFMSGGPRRLLQHYSHKVPVLHIVKYYLIGV